MTVLVAGQVIVGCRWSLTLSLGSMNASRLAEWGVSEANWGLARGLQPLEFWLEFPQVPPRFPPGSRPKRTRSMRPGFKTGPTTNYSGFEEVQAHPSGRGLPALSIVLCGALDGYRMTLWHRRPHITHLRIFRVAYYCRGWHDGFHALEKT